MDPFSLGVLAASAWFVCGILGFWLAWSVDKSAGFTTEPVHVFAVMLGPFLLLGAVTHAIAEAVGIKE